jgi:hypothetical protein
MTVKLVANEAKELNVKLTLRVAELHGRVRDAATWNVLQEVKVTLDSLVAYSNASGDFIFLGVVPGSYNILFEKEGYKPLSQSVSLVQGYNELFFNITPITQTEAYYTVSPEFKEINSNNKVYNVEFIITNTGELAGSQIVQWTATLAGGIVGSGSWDIALEPGESIAKVIPLYHPGYPVQGAAKVKTYQMEGQCFVHFYGGFGGKLETPVMDMPATAYLGEKFYVWLPLRNIGTGLLTYTVTFYIDGEQVGQSSGSLYPNGEVSPGYPLHIRLIQTGTYTISADIRWNSHTIEVSKAITVLSS